MAFYLKRAFAEIPDVLIYNNLRFVRNGEVAQIDHLVLHRYGFTLIESKSVTGKVEVNKQLEFVRVYGHKRTGMKSPISQVGMQAELLQNLLNDQKKSLRRKVMFGLVQAEFSNLRFTRLVAISDGGEIIRKQCDPPELKKADQVVATVRAMIQDRDQTQGLKGAMRRAKADKQTAAKMDEIDIAPFTDEELTAIQKFIRKQHTPTKPAESHSLQGRESNQSGRATHVDADRYTSRAVNPPSIPPDGPLNQSSSSLSKSRPSNSSPPKAPPQADVPVCQHCQSQNLRILYGAYGYYFECLACDQNTSIAVSCSGCGQKARVSKSKLEFSKKCAQCGRVDHYFTNPSP